MALSIAVAVTNFDTRSMKAVRKRLQVRDYFFRNLMSREIRSPTESEASSGYNSIDYTTSITSSTSTDSRIRSLSDSLPVSQLMSQTESDADSEAESQVKSQVETLIESVSESLFELRAELRGETRAETPKVCSDDFPKNYTEYCVKGSKKDVLQEGAPLRLMYGNRDLLNLGANLRKPMWPKVPIKHDVEALNADYSVTQCHNCSFKEASPLLVDQYDSKVDSTDKSVREPTTICCGRNLANDRHDFRVICKRNKH